MLIFGLICLGVNLSILESFNKGYKACTRILKILDRKPSIQNSDGRNLKDICTGYLSFKDVNFWYPFGPGSDCPQLQHVTFDALPERVIAIVGSNESGRNACLPLIFRFYDPKEGVVRLDGADLEDLNVSSMRRNMGLVDIEPQLFNRTVAENIAYGDNTRKVTMTEVIEAARSANIHSFVVSLPHGYNTQIGIAGGNLLSGGQKQRIAIARALVRNPKILVCNEITNNLDRESEKMVLESIEAARKGRTCIIIAHRLLTIQNADTIIFMHEGRINEMGTHSELLKKKGKYWAMWKSQNPLSDENFVRGKSEFNLVKEEIPPPPPPPSPLPKKIKKSKTKVPSPPAQHPPPPPPPKVEESGGCGLCNIIGLGIIQS